MKYKNGVYIEATVFYGGKKKRLKFSREIETAMDVADALSKAIAKKEMVVTSGFDGKHMTGSKHYEGNAFDMRSRIYTDPELRTLLDNLRDNLGPDYDVLDEVSHIHIEYDPKPGVGVSNSNSREPGVGVSNSNIQRKDSPAPTKKKMKHEKETKTDLEMAEREENNYWNVAYAVSTGHAGFFPGNADTGSDTVHSNGRSSRGRDWRYTQGRKNKNSAAAHKNKTQKEVESQVDYWLKLDIAINKIIKFIKNMVSWKKQKKRW